MQSGEYDRVLLDQKGLCPICGDPVVEPCIDHDHETGKRRGILCRKHNALLGMANDNLEILKNAVAYLQRWATEE